MDEKKNGGMGTIIEARWWVYKALLYLSSYFYMCDIFCNSVNSEKLNSKAVQRAKTFILIM